MSPPSVPSLRQRPRQGLSRPVSRTLLPCLAFTYNSRGQSPRLDGEKYGRFGHTCGGFEYHFAICTSNSLSHVSGKLNQSSNNAIKSPSICVDKLLFFVKLSPTFPINLSAILLHLTPASLLIDFLFA